MTPDITVITATIKGREDMLAEAVASVQAQTLPATRHLVYLDEARKGIIHSMNVLWPQVDTPWMQWLADDDILYPDHLEKVAALADDADIVHSYCDVEGRDGFLPNWSYEESGGWLTATALMRTALVRGLGGWDRDKWPEDHNFWVKARGAGARFAINRTPTWLYRFHDANMTFSPVQR